jgi:hypothetical protein
MSSSYYPYIMYGFYEITGEEIIDRDWLSEYFPDMEIVVTSVIRNYAECPCYGVICGLDDRGNLYVEDEQKEMVNLCYEATKHITLKSAVGYHLVLRGDYQLCQQVYSPEYH